MVASAHGQGRVQFAAGAVPLFPVPQTSHFKIAFSSPEDPSNRLPQSVQNTSDPIAAIALAPTICPASALESGRSKEKVTELIGEKFQGLI